MREGTVQRILTRALVLRFGKGPLMLSAGEFCNRDVVFGMSDEDVCALARRMRKHHVGSIVIVEDRPEGKAPIGIITDRDIVVDLIAIDPDRLGRAVARELLSGRLIVAREEEGLEDVMRRMRAEGVRRLPVIDRQGVLQGIITFDDLVEYLAVELDKLTALLQREQSRERDRRPASGPSTSSAGQAGLQRGAHS